MKTVLLEERDFMEGHKERLLGDPEIEALCKRCRAPITVIRASRGPTDEWGLHPIKLIQCSKDWHHLTVHSHLRLDD